MSSLSEMRKELRELRKESVKPVSRMKKGDIAAEITRMSVKREETPAPAATPSSAPKKMASTVSTIKKAKEAEFPTEPVVTKANKVTGKVAKEAPAAPKPKSKGITRDMLQAMLDGLEADD